MGLGHECFDRGLAEGGVRCAHIDEESNRARLALRSEGKP